jgi:hypothetical protein
MIGPDYVKGLKMFAMVTVFASGAFLDAFATMRRDIPALATFHRTARTARFPTRSAGHAGLPTGSRVCT